MTSDIAHRKRSAGARVVMAAVVLAVLATGVRSAEDGLDTELMQAIEDSNKSLASNIALKAAKGANTDAQELSAMFAKVQAYYTQKGDAPDAVELAGKSHAFTQQILRSVAANDYAAATDAATALSRTCKTCHNFYKKS